MGNVHVLSNLFRGGDTHFSLGTTGNSAMDYNFKYFSGDTPYVPLVMTTHKNDMVPMGFRLLTGGWRSSSYYMEMLKNSTLYRSMKIVEHQTQSNKRFAVGSGQMYELTDRYGAKSEPLFMVVIPNHIYHEVMEYHANPFGAVLNRYKHYIEVMFHNNIRHVNQSLWNYIRNCYLEALELEGLRFTFKDPDLIWDLTTVSYQKPTFTSMKEMKQFKQDINDEIVLSNFE